MKVKDIVDNMLLNYAPNDELVVLWWDSDMIGSDIQELVDSSVIAVDVGEKYEKQLWSKVVELAEDDDHFDESCGYNLSEIMNEVLAPYREKM